MQSDNLDSFEKLVFSTPDTRKLIAGSTLASLVFGSITFLAIEGFTTVNLDLFSLVSLILFVYLIPSVVATESMKTFLSGIERGWALLLTLANQGILFLFSIIITAADSIASAWSVLWLCLITVYLFTFFILTLVEGTEYLKRIGFVSAVQPAIILASFHIFLGRQLLIPLETYILNLLLLLVGAGMLILLVFVVEYLIGSNVSNISAFNLTSTLLQRKEEGLDLGYPARADVQTLEVDNGSSFRFAAPWVHPGPIAGFGGGDLTQDFIERLNKDGEGFFLHVPTTHHADMVNPGDKDRVYDALEKPETHGKASEMIHRDVGIGTIYGRKFNGQNIIYIDIQDYDDFELSIFRESVDLDKTMVVDIHREGIGQRKEMYYGTSIADKLEKEVREFEEELEELEEYEYHAGKAVSINGRSSFAMVEEVNGQEVLIAGFDSNGMPEELLDLEIEMKEDYDYSLFLSTDTHSSLKQMAEQEEFDVDEVRKTVQKADDDVSPASIGFSNRKSEKISLLKEDYQGLIFSINILIRLLPIALILMYIGLVIWLL